MVETPPRTNRPSSSDERFRLYIDESGDHVFKHLDDPAHRFLCLLGCWAKGSDYREIHREMESLKQRHIPHHPDEPIILHREDILHRRKQFWRLRDVTAAAAFDKDLLHLLSSAEYKVVAIVIDKLALRLNYPAPAHPYHLAMGFLLQRYCGYLNHINRVGDVMAESRGGAENRLFADSFERVYERGCWQLDGHFFQEALTSRKLKISQKSDNITGLQLADLLAHPARQLVLMENGRITGPLSAFGSRMAEILQSKFNRHLYAPGKEGYGKVLFPK